MVRKAKNRIILIDNYVDDRVLKTLDHAITDDERMRIGVPTKDAYLEFFQGDTASVNTHLTVLAHIRENLEARANYIKRLPADKLNEVLEIIMEKYNGYPQNFEYFTYE